MGWEELWDLCQVKKDTKQCMWHAIFCVKIVGKIAYICINKCKNTEEKLLTVILGMSEGNWTDRGQEC